MDDIVGAAYELGHDAISMRSVASRLGVAVSSLYYYVESADELRQLLAARALESFDVSLSSTEPLAPQIRGLAYAIRRLFEGTPGLAQQAMHDQEWGDTILTLHEQVCGALVQRGVSAAEAFLTVRTVVDFVEGYVARAERLEGHSRMPQGSAAQYPLLDAAHQQLAHEDSEAYFEFGLDAILKGLPMLEDGSSP